MFGGTLLFVRVLPVHDCTDIFDFLVWIAAVHMFSNMCFAAATGSCSADMMLWN